MSTTFNEPCPYCRGTGLAEPDAPEVDEDGQPQDRCPGCGGSGDGHDVEPPAPDPYGRPADPDYWRE